MMRAWAAIPAAAVLVALPMSVERAAGSALANATVPTAAVDAGVSGNAPQLTASSLGVLIWLSVAVLAVIVAFVVLRHSRTQAAADTGLAGVTPLSAGPLAFSEFPGSSSTAGGR